MSEWKLCRDCKHVGKSDTAGDRLGTLWRCNRPGTINLVTGIRTSRDTYCDWQREGKNGFWRKDYCTEAGIYFEPADALPPPPEVK